MASGESPVTINVKTARPTNAAASAASFWPRVVLLVGVTFVTFVPVLSGDFVWDDVPNVLTNESFRGLDTQSLHYALATFDMGHFQPLSWLSLSVDHALWGLNPFGYHLSNLLLHCANAVLVFLLARRLLKPTEMGRTRPYFADNAAVVAALLFALHPLRVESVAWVTERRDVLSALFLLAGVLCYVTAHEPRRPPRRFAVIAAWLLFVTSLLAKAGGMTLPFVLIALDWFPLRRLGWGRGWRHGGVWAEKLAYLLPALVFAVIAAAAQGDISTPLSEHSVVGRIAQASFGLVFYLGRTIVPFGLTPLHELVLPIDPLSSRYALSMSIVSIVAVAIVVLARRAPGLAVAGFVYVATLGPVLGFLQSGPQEVAERYSYLPTLGWLVLLGWAVQRLADGPARVSLRHPLAPPLLATAVIAAMLAPLTWRQTEVWQSDLSLWSHAATLAPDSRFAQRNLAYARRERDDRTGAVAAFRAARAAAPVYPEFGLARLLIEEGRHVEAIADLRALLAHHPGRAELRALMGEALLASRDFRAALTQFEEAVRLEAGNVTARLGLIDTLAAMDSTDEAAGALRLLLQGGASRPSADAAILRRIARRPRVRELLAQLEDAPSQVAGSNSRVAAIIEKARGAARFGEPQQALRLYAEALDNQPDNPIVHYEMGSTLLSIGESDSAAGHFVRAATLRDDVAVFHLGLGLAYQQMGDAAKALTAYEAALARDAELLEAHYNAGGVLLHLQRPAEARVRLARALELARVQGRADIEARVIARLDEIDAPGND